MRISQGYISDSIRGSGLRLLEKYKLREYNPLSLTARKHPCLFLGCYTRKDVKRVCEHKGFRILIWTGRDILRLGQPVHRVILKHPEIVHIALSEFTAADLRRVNLPYVMLPVCISNFDQFQSTPLGDSVYSYGVCNDPGVYGGSLVKELQRRLPSVSFLFGDYDVNYKPWYLPERMHEVYAKCFIGLRLTTHDGFPNTVAELGLMGRRCVWNGFSPNAISWKNLDDVAKAIELEQVYIGKENLELAASVRKFLDIGESWLTTEFYQGVVCHL